mgnify:CR=1 FL=1
MKKGLLATLCAIAMLAAAGCASTPAVSVKPDGPLQVGRGDVPLLKVTVHFDESSWAGRPGWGGMSQPNPRLAFARLV